MMIGLGVVGWVGLFVGIKYAAMKPEYLRTVFSIGFYAVAAILWYISFWITKYKDIKMIAFLLIYFAAGALIGIKHISSGRYGELGKSITFVTYIFLWPIFIFSAKYK